MKRILLLVFSFVSIHSAKAGKFVDDSTATNSVTIKAEYFFGSNAITNDFVNTYFRNAFIDNSKKDKISDHLQYQNRFGAGFNYEFNFKHRADSMFGLPNAFYQIGFRDNYHFDARFSNDAFELFFRGNKNYAGKTADLSNFEFKQLYYQQLYFYIGQMLNEGENQYEYSFGINFNKGQQFLSIATQNATLFTEANGEFIDLDAALEIHRSDSLKEKKIDFNGIGASIDMSFNWVDKKKRKLEFALQNFGFIDWNEKSSFVKADTAFRFEGVDISDLFDFTDSIANSISLDSSLVQPYLTDRKKQTYSTPLPALIRVAYSIPLEKVHTVLETTLGYLAFANSRPYISENIQYQVNRNHSFGLKFRYGGYSGFNIGFNYELKFSGWKFQLRSDQIDGLLLKDATAQGAFVSLTKYF